MNLVKTNSIYVANVINRVIVRGLLHSNKIKYRLACVCMRTFYNTRGGGGGV